MRALLPQFAQLANGLIGSKTATKPPELTSIATLLKVACDTAHRELETSLGRLCHSLLAGGLSLATSRHVEEL